MYFFLHQTLYFLGEDLFENQFKIALVIYGCITNLPKLNGLKLLLFHSFCGLGIPKRLGQVVLAWDPEFAVTLGLQSSEGLAETEGSVSLVLVYPG